MLNQQSEAFKHWLQRIYQHQRRSVFRTVITGADCPDVEVEVLDQEKDIEHRTPLCWNARKQFTEMSLL